MRNDTPRVGTLHVFVFSSASLGCGSDGGGRCYNSCIDLYCTTTCYRLLYYSNVVLQYRLYYSNTTCIDRKRNVAYRIAKPNQLDPKIYDTQVLLGPILGVGPYTFPWLPGTKSITVNLRLVLERRHTRRYKTANSERSTKNQTVLGIL